MIDINFIAEVVKKHSLGELNWAETKLLVGGRIHQVWRIKTDKIDYVVKFLNPNKVTICGIEKYKIAESISASVKQQGVNAVTAITLNNELVHNHNNQFYLFFPYITGGIIECENIQPGNAKKIGELLAKLHMCEFKEVNLPLTKWDYNINPSWSLLTNKIDDLNIKSLLQTVMSELVSIHEECEKACKILANKEVMISHGDLDTPNIVWEQNQPNIIDWEYSGYIHPLRDVINTALYWSEVAPGKLDLECYSAVISEYQKFKTLPNSENHKEAFYAVLGGWMQWIHYNMRRLANDIEANEAEKKLAAQQIEKFIETVISVRQQEGQLLKLLLENPSVSLSTVTKLNIYSERQQQENNNGTEVLTFNAVVPDQKK